MFFISVHIMASTNPTPNKTITDSWETIADVRDYFGVTMAEWQKVASELGDAELNDMGLLVGITDQDYAAARDSAGLSPLRKGVLNLLFGAIKLKYNIHTVIIQYVKQDDATKKDANSKDGHAGQETETALMPVSGITVPTLQARVKLSQVLNQSLDQDIPLLNEEALREHRRYYIEACGDEPLPNVDATDGQLTALWFAVECGLAPYADFGVFGPHGTRHEKRMRFAQHFQDTSGKWRAVEQHGPANIEVWRTCWETFSVAAISLRIAKPAVLARYAQKFEERCSRYTRAWHLCVKADDRCRAEFWQSERRRQDRFHGSHPDLSAIDPLMPWNHVIKESAENLEFWLHELQEPALMYSQVRGDSTPSWVHQQRDELEQKGKGKRKGGGHDGTHPRKRQGKYTTNVKGMEICFKFNSNSCYPGCPRAHQCSNCLGRHAADDCSKGKGRKGKGANAQKKGEQQAASST